MAALDKTMLLLILMSFIFNDTGKVPSLTMWAACGCLEYPLREQSHSEHEKSECSIILDFWLLHVGGWRLPWSYVARPISLVFFCC